MSFSSTSKDRLMNMYLALAQYPILSARILKRMRKELVEHGIMDARQFDAEVRQKAILSQAREGLTNPFSEEPTEVWELRQSRVRDYLTLLFYSQHLDLQSFERIVNDVLGERGMSIQELMLSLNPELAPQELVFEQAMTIEKLNVEERSRYQARLQETKVVLIRNLISDQLAYINIAKEWFTIHDLADIRQRKIGAGKIGGKAAGMLLAYRILKENGDPALQDCLHVPESFFIGADEMYNFMAVNNLVHWNDQKYKNEEEMRAEYPMIVEDFMQGTFHPDILEKLETVLARVGNQPLIVRSSSLLEDNFGTSFAGKYESVFCPNQGNLTENLKALSTAIIQVYASTLNPDALLYRRSRGLQDYDERMAVLIQVVQGERYGRYYLPHAAGVAFSRNLYRWAPQIRREDGFARLVWGMGTRAVDRVGNDFPRLVALSHPLLRPSNEPKSIRRYSQQYVDVIDLEENRFRTLPIHDLLDSRYPPVRYLAQVDEGGYFVTLRSAIMEGDRSQLVLTFDELLRRTPLADRLRQTLQTLERCYHAPIDMEFCLGILNPETGTPRICLTVLQCRPQSHLIATEQFTWPDKLPEEQIAFRTQFIVPQGKIDRVDYVVFVSPEGYYDLPSEQNRREMARAVGRLNAALKEERFICVGPGRWGSSNSDLGVPIGYGDIYHTRSLVELAGAGFGLPPEPSLGTHFFQDLIESQIYPLAVQMEDANSIFNRKFFYDTPNHVEEWIHLEPALQGSLRLIKVSDFRPRCHLRVLMDDNRSLAVAYFEPDRA